MLLAYLNDAEADRTIASMIIRLDERMNIIKQEAESLEYRELTDETFQNQIAYLCVYVMQLKERIEYGEKDVERFIENAFKKFRTYFDLYQDIQSLISLFTTNTNNKVGISDWLKRVPKMEQTSNFNVIKINTHSIDIQYKNKALVVPDTTLIKIPSTTTATAQESNVLEFLKEGSETRETIVNKINTVVETFQTAQNELRVYQSRYTNLGNKTLLKSERLLLDERLVKVVDYLQEVCLSLKSPIIVEIEGLTGLFDEMITILDKECDHCREYIFNVVSRFMETSIVYTKLLTLLRHNNVDLECLKSDTILNTSVERECCSSMF